MNYDCEEKIVELTSGDDFEKYLLLKGLNKEDSITIQNQLLNDFYMNYIKEDTIEIRLNYIINKMLIDRKIASKEINYLTSDEKFLIYLYNQDHTVMHCTNCNSTILYNDSYCHNCGMKTKYNSTSKVGYNKIKDTKQYSPKDDINQTTSTLNDNKKIKLDYAIFTFLEYINNDPVFSSNQKFSDTINNQTIIDYVTKNDLAVHPSGNNTFYMRLTKLPEIEIKNIANKFKIDYADKETTIHQLIKTVPSDKLDKIIPNDVYHITEKGLKIVQSNPQIFFYNKFLRNYSLIDFEKYYNENKSRFNVSQIGLGFITNIRNNNKEELKWDDYRNTYLTEYLISRFIKNQESVILSLLSVFVCDMNHWDNNKLSTNSTIVAPFVSSMLINAKIEYNLNENQINHYFTQACDKIEIPYFIIPQHAMYIYLKRILNNESIELIKKEVKTKLHFNPTMNYTFKNKYEEDKVVKEIRNVYY